MTFIGVQQHLIFGDLHTFLTTKYTVRSRYVQTELGLVQHIMVSRRDMLPVHDWRDLQEIKNQVVGPEIQAIEIYPPEGLKCDTGNVYHLWAFLDGMIPIGFSESVIDKNTQEPVCL